MCSLRTACHTCTHTRHPVMGRCPCDLLKDGDEEVVEGSILLRGVLGLRSCWTAWYRGPSATVPPGQTHSNSPAVEARTAPFLQAYRAHVGHTAKNCHFCLRCGKLPRDNRTGFQDHLDGRCISSSGPLTATVLVAARHLVSSGSAQHWVAARLGSMLSTGSPPSGHWIGAWLRAS